MQSKHLRQRALTRTRCEQEAAALAEISSEIFNSGKQPIRLYTESKNRSGTPALRTLRKAPNDAISETRSWWEGNKGLRYHSCRRHLSFGRALITNCKPFGACVESCFERTSCPRLADGNLTVNARLSLHCAAINRPLPFPISIRCGR